MRVMPLDNGEVIPCQKQEIGDGTNNDKARHAVREAAKAICSHAVATQSCVRRVSQTPPAKR